MIPIRKSEGNKNFGVYYGLMILLCASVLSSCSKGPANSGAVRPKLLPKVTQEEVHLKNVVYHFTAVGSLEAQEEVQVPARVSGVIDKVFFQEGDVVKTDSILVEIDRERYRLESKKVKAERDQMTAELKNAQDAYQRRMELRKKNAGWVTEEELSTFSTAVDKSRASLDRVKAEYALARKNLKDSRVQPPIPGIIDKKSVSTGEYVQSNSSIATIRNLSSLRLKFAIPETESCRIRLGQKVQFTVKPFPEKIYEAEIYFISSAADLATRLVECKAKVVSPDALKPGFFANLKIETESHADAMVVPEEAVRATELGFVVYALSESSEGTTAKAQVVKLGLRTEGEVEILSGLEKGSKIAILGSDALYDGAKVQVISEEKQS